MENSKNFSILSLDGGGIRGMLTATLLVTLENEIKAINPEYNLTNCFDFWLFGLCYAMDEDYKGWNPYLERHLAIFVNCSLLNHTK